MKDVKYVDCSERRHMPRKVAGTLIAISDNPDGNHTRRIMFVEKFLDIDYMHTLKGEDLKFMADFLLYWMQKHKYEDGTFRNNAAERDMHTVLVRYNNGGREVVKDDVDRLPPKNKWDECKKNLKEYKKKMGNSYTLRDYTSSFRFNENALIDIIDEQKLKEMDIKTDKQ